MIAMHACVAHQNCQQIYLFLKKVAFGNPDEKVLPLVWQQMEFCVIS
jgi:hypothetical protein